MHTALLSVQYRMEYGHKLKSEFMFNIEPAKKITLRAFYSAALI